VISLLDPDQQFFYSDIFAIQRGIVIIRITSIDVEKRIVLPDPRRTTISVERCGHNMNRASILILSKGETYRVNLFFTLFE